MPEIPKGAKVPQDRKLAQVEVEGATAPPIEFTFDGITYLIESDFLDDLEVLEDVEMDRNIAVVSRLLGPRQWLEWKEKNRGKDGRIRASEAEPFLLALFEAVGLGN